MNPTALATSAESSTNSAVYRLQIVERVADLNEADWDSLRTEDDCAFMDRRFIEAVEGSRPGGSKIWSVLIYCGNRPVAAACLSLFPADAAVVASGWVKRLTERIRKVFPRYARFNVLFCGLPVSAGEGHLTFSPDADRGQALRLLDKQMRLLARQHRAKILIFKELDEERYRDSTELKSLGYLGVQSTAMNYLQGDFASFDDYRTAMRSRYRRNGEYSERAFAAAGFRLETFSGGEATAAIYTDEVHRLYESVFDRSKMKVERLPAEFFRELARRFPTEFVLVLAYHNDRVIGSFTGIRTRNATASLFVGVDYELNVAGEIYFNMFFGYLRAVMSPEVNRIFLGADSDDFKARIGSRQCPNYMYVAATNWLRFPLRWFVKSLFPPIKMREPLHVFTGSRTVPENSTS